MRSVTLGGDRLGSGNKFKVGLRGFERSTHDLSYTWKTTMSAGTLVPFLFETGLPGDTFDIELDCNIKTHPTIGPLFDTYKIQLDVFKCDWRLYNGKLHNNKLRAGLQIGDAIKLPLIRLYAFKSTNSADDINISQINPSSILSYMDIRGVIYVDAASAATAYAVDFNAIKLLAYWDAYKNYYANKQELVGAVIHNIRPTIVTFDTVTIHNPPSYSSITLPLDPAVPTVTPIGPGSLIRLNYTTLPPNPETVMINQGGTYVPLLSLFAYPTTTATYVQLVWNGTSSPTTIEQWRYITSADIVPAPPNVQTFPLDDLDNMREELLAATKSATPVIINTLDLFPYKYIANNTVPTTDYDLNYSLNQEGLAIKTYQSDLFNNWLRTEDIIGPDSISEITGIDISAGGILTMDQLNLQQKVYNMLSRVAAAGNSYDDYINAVYAHQSHSKPEIPVYCGGLSKELVFQEVISNAETADQPLGTLAGRGVMGHKHKGGKMHIKCDEFCTIMGLISLTPRIVYSQGNKWDNYIQTLDDLHKPDLDGIGYQSLMSYQLAWWDTQINGGSGGNNRIVGFQPAWVNYMTNVNRTYGNFAIANNEMFMTLNRRYEMDGSLLELSDLTTYIDPGKFNHIFAHTSLDAQNFWAQIAVNMTARRKMSAKQIPNL